VVEIAGAVVVAPAGTVISLSSRSPDPLHSSISSSPSSSVESAVVGAAVDAVVGSAAQIKLALHTAMPQQSIFAAFHPPQLPPISAHVGGGGGGGGGRGAVVVIAGRGVQALLVVSHCNPPQQMVDAPFQLPHHSSRAAHSSTGCVVVAGGCVQMFS
jgi:hypothetical protein